MSKFENVTVVKAANVYFDGKVTSRTVEFASGEKKTLGIMLPGEYKFSTAKKEIMEILSGTVEILLPGSQTWQTIRGGESFEVDANAAFGIKVLTVTDYCCSYLD
ncbi:MAG: pyrimidine/purine nucleoside phosphorylase [Gammaproteobacteria bacterium]|nr:pyrimidine/purine nucleoside phosphorylase [Gammaproteobacteria bacterium]MDP2139507.1 pyrimidine/purine nucleoside phosphorylase [Gammaproteobacteria bacterium]MDP2348462.1 pyrimidine/purine nucleoside phosphorylase [Gammaproteobacteria bacterium]